MITTPIIKDKIVPKNETSKISGNMTTDLSASSSKDIKNNSANDYGMEYPIVDNDPQVRWYDWLIMTMTGLPIIASLK